MDYCRVLILALLVGALGCSRGSRSIQPANANASSEAKRLLASMDALRGRGVMIGHQDDLAYGVRWKTPNGQSDVYDICSDFPAVFGWDMGHIELGASHNLDSVSFDDMARFAIKVDAMGGINTFSWHCRNPLTGGDAWDISAPGVVASILPGGPKHQLFNQWLDRVASFIASLKDSSGANIPVILRPFHEQSGSWFWWGKGHCSPEQFTQLWRYTFSYLVEVKGVNSAIFAFSTGWPLEEGDDFPDRYPGDSYVDIVGFDIYQGPNQANDDFAVSLKCGLKRLVGFASGRNKLPAITEIGFEQVPDPEWWTTVVYPSVAGSPISYMLFWRNANNRPNHYYVPYPGQISAADFVGFYDLPRTLFLKDIAR